LAGPGRSIDLDLAVWTWPAEAVRLNDFELQPERLQRQQWGASCTTDWSPARDPSGVLPRLAGSHLPLSSVMIVMLLVRTVYSDGAVVTALEPKASRSYPWHLFRQRRCAHLVAEVCLTSELRPAYLPACSNQPHSRCSLNPMKLSQLGAFCSGGGSLWIGLAVSRRLHAHHAVQIGLHSWRARAVPRSFRDWTRYAAAYVAADEPHAFEALPACCQSSSNRNRKRAQLQRRYGNKVSCANGAMVERQIEGLAPPTENR